MGVVVEPRRFVCLKCEAIFEAEMLMRVAVEVYIAQMKTVRCPKCGAGGTGVAFRTDPPVPDTDDTGDPVTDSAA